MFFDGHLYKLITTFLVYPSYSPLFTLKIYSLSFQTFRDHPLTRVHRWHGQEINSTVGGNNSDPAKPTPRDEPNTALLTTILLFGTVLLTVKLREFRHSHFFGRKVRYKHEIF